MEKERVQLEEEVGESAVIEEIRLLRERVKARQDGDVILRFGSRIYRIDRDIIKALPFGLGSPLLGYLRILEGLEKGWLPTIPKKNPKK